MEYIVHILSVNNEYQTRANAVIEAGADVITVDIAHGHSVAMIEQFAFYLTVHPFAFRVFQFL